MESASDSSSQKPEVGFWKGAFLDTDGTPSIGSLLAGICLAFVLGWTTAIVYVHLRVHFEPVIPDLAGPIALISAVMGVHRLGNYFEGKNGPQDDHSNR